MATERIESLISKEALGQFDELNAKLAMSVTAFEKLIAKGVALNKEFGGATGFKKYNEGAQALSENEKALNAQAKELERAQAKLNATFTQTANEIAKAKVVSAEVSKQMKEEAKEALGLVGAYDKLTKEYNEAAKEARNLAIQFGAGSKEAQEASKRALELDQRLKAADASVGRFNKNVGNYEGAAKTIVEAFERQKQKVEQVTKAYGAFSPEANMARRELDALQRVTEGPGFLKLAASAGDSQRELKTLTRSLIEMERAGMGSTEVAIELRHRLAELKDQVDDTKAEIKALASDTRNFDLFAGSVKFLADSFQTAAGAVGLFSDSEEEVQQITKNLIAIQSIANGIKGVATELTERGTAANKLYAWVQGQVAVATNTSAAATLRLGAAMKLVGIGALVALVAGLIIAYQKLTGAQSKAIETQNKLNDATKDYYDALVKVNQELGRSLDSQTQGLRDQLAILEKQGATAYELFELKKQIAESDRQNALEGLRDLGLTAAGIDRLVLKQDQLNEKLVKAQEFRKKALEIDFDDAVEKADQQIESIQKEIAANDALIKQGSSLVQTYQDATEALKQLNTEQNTFSREDRLKAAFEANRRLLEDSIDINSRIVSDERNSLQVRLTAIERIGIAQRHLIEKQRDFELADTTKTELQKRTIRANAGAELVKLERDIQEQIAEERRKFQEKEFAAQFEILRNNIETNALINQRIADDEKKSLETRLENNLQYFQRQRALITGQRDFELRNKTLTESERKAIEERANNELLLLQAEFVKKSNDIQNQALEQAEQNTINRNAARRDKLLEAVTRERADGVITEEQYQKKRLDIEFKYAQAELMIQINNAKKKLEIRRASGEDVTGLLAQIAALERQLEEDSLNHTITTEDKKLQARLKALNVMQTVSQRVFDIVGELSSIQYETEKARVTEQIAAIEKRRDAELAAINASALSEQEKADKIQILEAQVLAQKEQQERRLKQLEADRARFERATTVQRIIADTAAAVVAALGAKPYSPLNIALAATVGALGAAQLARVIATPLPRFATGTQDAPGGAAWVGDAGRAELVKEPGGKMWVTPSVPTVMNVPKHSIVYPDARLALESGLAVNRHGRLVERDNGIQKIAQKLDKLTSVIRNKPVLNMSASESGLTAMWSYGASRVSYVEDQTKF